MIPIWVDLFQGSNFHTKKTPSRKNLSNPETEHSEIHHDEFGVECYYDKTVVELKERLIIMGVRIRAFANKIIDYRAFSLTNGMGMILNVQVN